MVVRYMRVSKADSSQSLDLQRDALAKEGIKPDATHEDMASGKRDDRPGLEACMKAVRRGGRPRRMEARPAWAIVPPPGRDRKKPNERGIRLKVLSGQGAQVDQTTPAGKLVSRIFAALSEFERERIVERTKAGLQAARARGRKGGRIFALTKAQVRMMA